MKPMAQSEPGLPAPAVAAAVRILDFLAKQTPRAGVTEIARALGINKSTCFNILLTLAHYGVVAKLPGVAKYQLGPRLAELGGALRRQYGHRELLRRHLEALVVETQLVCVIGQVLGDETSFVIIDQIAPPGAKSRSPAPNVGAVFPLTAPAMGRALLSSLDEEDAMSIVRSSHAPIKAAEEAEWRAQLRKIRSAGYATSLEQYKHGVNAVASPIQRAGEAYLVAALVGHARDLSGRRIEEIGPQLARATRELREGLAIVGGET
jgi:DNA-binding IclR family transcriptional regulator